MKTIFYKLVCFSKTINPALIWTIFVFVMCTIPSPRLPSNLPNDKTSHLLAFSAFSFLWFFRSPRIILIFLAGTLFGVIIECWQAILPASFHRGFEHLDILADCTGTAIGLAVAYPINYYIQKHYN